MALSFIQVMACRAEDENIRRRGGEIGAALRAEAGALACVVGPARNAWGETRWAKKYRR